MAASSSEWGPSVRNDSFEEHSVKENTNCVSTQKITIITKSINIDSFLFSFYIKVFGLGTLIYCGLELGAFFEVPSTSPCHDLVNGLNPALQIAFTFLQMYFIFMNAKVRQNDPTIATVIHRL
jgi:hypothetical protein